MITYLDYTLVPLPCPRTQHSRLFLSRKPLTLKIRSSTIPFLWKRVNNMFQRDWKVIFFFIKSLSRQNCLQPCGRNRPFAYIESGLNYQTRTGIRTSPSGVLRFKHRVTIILTWRDHPYIEKKLGASTHLLMVPGSYWTERWRCFYRRRWQQRLGKYILHVETMQSVPILSEVQIR